MIKNIVFDIGNVLVTFYPTQYFTKHFHSREESERLCTLIFSHEVWGKYDQGIMAMKDVKEYFKQAYLHEYEKIEYILNHWLDIMQLMPETLTYMRELKERGYKLYLLSNISEDSAQYLKQIMPFFQLVDGEILSYKIKQNKPNEAIYRALLDTYQVRSEETIFFDDIMANIQQANTMGIHGILFLDIEDAKAKAEEIIRSMEIC